MNPILAGTRREATFHAGTVAHSRSEPADLARSRTADGPRRLLGTRAVSSGGRGRSEFLEVGGMEFRHPAVGGFVGPEGVDGGGVEIHGMRDGHARGLDPTDEEDARGDLGGVQVHVLHRSRCRSGDGLVAQTRAVGGLGVVEDDAVVDGELVGLAGVGQLAHVREAVRVRQLGRDGLMTSQCSTILPSATRKRS